GTRMRCGVLVRAMVWALIIGVPMLPGRVVVPEWVAWAEQNGVRPEIRDFIFYMPEALMRPVPAEPVPFSTPRAWTMLSRALDLAEASRILTSDMRRILAFGRVSAEDAAVFCALADELIEPMKPLNHYIDNPKALPEGEAARWFILNCIRQLVKDGRLRDLPPATINRFLASLPDEHQLTLLADLVDRWGALGADK